MSKAFQQAFASYTAGKFDLAVTQLATVTRGAKIVETPVALLMAQSCYKLGRLAEAALWYERASAKARDNAPQLQLLAANLYWKVKDARKALELSRKLAGTGDGNIEALALYRNCLRFLLLFDDMEASDRALLAKLQAGDTALFAMEQPLDHTFWCADEAVNMRLTRMDGATPFTPQSQSRRRAMPHAYADRIRIGYLSNDISDRHATMRLIQGVFLAHDRERFDITIFCHTDDGVISTDEGMRQRYDTLVRIGHLSDVEAVALIRSMGIDILVDLKGHTRDARLNILNIGAAPVQVAWLGFPGIPTGIDCDYMIGDAVVTPDGSKPFYHQKFCRLPESYQANDDTWRALPAPASRASLGLPEDRIVFASFNTTLKISPQTFRFWVRILKSVENSVLWILCEHPATRENLLAEMGRAGIAADRIIYADRAAYPQHVARLQAADIGLDTFPCNGHTTTSDKLWAGLPVITFKGSNFASRVSESLLRALDMPELVAEDGEAYVELCADLAGNPAKLAAIRAKIAARRFTAPLFDTQRFTRHLEKAYEMMVDRAKKGLEPDHIDVPAMPPRTQPFRC